MKRSIVEGVVIRVLATVIGAVFLLMVGHLLGIAFFSGMVIKGAARKN